MSLWQWSTTAANNASADPSINWAEGQAPSTVNDSARAMMAAVASQYQGGWDWQNMGDTPTYVSATTFTVPGNLTTRYLAGRRIRAFVTAGTIYGTIQSPAFTSLTTVTVTWDSGALDSGLSEVDLGIILPTNSSFPAKSTIRGTGTQADFTLSLSDTASRGGGDVQGGASIKFTGNSDAGTPTKVLHVINGVFCVANDAYTNNILKVDDGGNLTMAGNVTASSDERLKTDWQSLPSDFIERLAAVKSGTYRRVDGNLRQVGVGAQSLQSLMPEAVLEGNEGMLSVAYGNAALVACVELAKEVIRLRALLEPVK